MNEDGHQLISNAVAGIFIPSGRLSATLVLFGGYAEVAEDIQREFTVRGTAARHGIAIMYMNDNDHLFLAPEQLDSLATVVVHQLNTYALPADELFIGGFSSGGNIALLLADHFTSSRKNGVSLKGCFAIDPPVDLEMLFQLSLLRVEHFPSDNIGSEGRWLSELLQRKLGDPRVDGTEYRKRSVYTLSSRNIENIKHLQSTPIRLYTEYDPIWWMEQRNDPAELTNAYYLKHLASTLDSLGFEFLEYIESTDKGYRADGSRHPHSWSIADPGQIVKWLMRH